MSCNGVSVLVVKREMLTHSLSRGLNIAAPPTGLSLAKNQFVEPVTELHCGYLVCVQFYLSNLI